jgi:hypothetical protein
MGEVLLHGILATGVANAMIKALYLVGQLILLTDRLAVLSHRRPPLIGGLTPHVAPGGAIAVWRGVAQGRQGGDALLAFLARW